MRHWLIFCFAAGALGFGCDSSTADEPEPSLSYEQAVVRFLDLSERLGAGEFDVLFDRFDDGEVYWRQRGSTLRIDRVDREDELLLGTTFFLGAASGGWGCIWTLNASTRLGRSLCEPGGASAYLERYLLRPSPTGVGCPSVQSSPPGAYCNEGWLDVVDVTGYRTSTVLDRPVECFDVIGGNVITLGNVCLEASGIPLHIGVRWSRGTLGMTAVEVEAAPSGDISLPIIPTASWEASKDLDLPLNEFVLPETPLVAEFRADSQIDP